MDKETILAGWLVDGTGAAASENVRLTIQSGRIESIDTAVPEPPAKGAVCRDLSGYTLLPLLCDCHTHLVISGTFDPAFRKKQGNLENDTPGQIISEHIGDYLRHGVLSVRDGGDNQGHVLRYRSDTPELNRLPFRLYTPGVAWHRQGRYGKFIGRAVPAGIDPVPLMKTFAKQGIDHIKVIQSGLNSLTSFGMQTAPQFDKNAVSKIFALCRALGIGLMVHANGRVPVGIAVDGGCDSIEHGYFMGDENLRKMADARITWVPTMAPMKAYADNAPAKSQESQVAVKTLDHQLEQLFRARRYGVPVALGTDAGSPGVQHGKAVPEELKLLVSAGYSIEEAVGCATMTAAALMKSGTSGCLRAGDPASFLAVKGSPSEVPERLGCIEMIMVAGRPIDLHNQINA